MTGKLGLDEALEMAMYAERKARDFYAQAARATEDQAGRDLLGRLAAFEQYHFDWLSELARSLREDGRFIDYETRSIEQFAPDTGLGSLGGAAAGETGATQLEGLDDKPSILSAAIDNEKIAGERYRGLAEETADPRGQAMFRDLADEEKIHQRILEDEFYSLSNKGAWGWSGMFGD